MGLSIHYSGYIRDLKMLDPLIEEVRDICQTLQWRIHTFDDEDIKGISFAPEGSESVFLTFNMEGRTLSPINIIVKDIYDGDEADKDLIFTTSTKTQYAGADAHIAIIKLLKYISSKYLKDFTVFDEGSYWETGDEKVFLKQFARYEAALDSFTDLLKGMKSVPGESAESLADSLERIFKEKLGGDSK
jgi:hypothetical protein